MKKAKKLISLLVLFLSLALIMADDSFLVQSYFDQKYICTNCPDISDHFEHSHKHLTDDNIVLNETMSKTPYVIQTIGSVNSLTINFQSNFISKVWQPPKLS
jgi:predicted dithiol-disulfide oxidoreductase (DUF899 family)